MSDIKVTPLGAGQDVGRSCILVSIGSKNVMLDCGMHMGYNDERRFPDFSFITKETDLTDYLDCLIISHFHLDHCGALPYMTEMIGYNGPIYMTHPTKAICPILLEDFRRIAVERKGETNFFTSGMIKDCMKKVTAVNLHQVVQVDEELEIKAYYAGHVLGAAMFQIKVGNQVVVYTGDYNMTPDRHLGAAWIDRCRPDLLITESTYATTIRDSKRCRERDFLLKVHDCVEHGGKVLIPVFALGRAQELCILLETYWERMNLKVPIYFAIGLTEKATNYYKMFISWTNQKIKKTFVQRNMFDFKHIKPFDRQYINNPGAMVVFATPGMLHAGLSLQIFKAWAPSPQNMVIMPGYCVAGTIGHKILNGQRMIELENRQIIEVKMKVEYMSFSAHADAKGIMQLVSHCSPRAVLLVHGEEKKMAFLAKKIKDEFEIDCYMPANGQTVSIPTRTMIPIDVSRTLLKRTLNSETSFSNSLTSSESSTNIDEDIPIGASDPKKPKILHGTLVITNDPASGGTSFKLVEPERIMQEVGLKPHIIRYTSTVRFEDPKKSSPARLTELIFHKLKQKLKEHHQVQLHGQESTIQISSVRIKVDQTADDEQMKDVFISWADQEDELGSFLVKFLKDNQKILLTSSSSSTSSGSSSKK